MSDYLIDVTKVHSANAAALETALDTQMWGMEETNYTIGAKDSGDTMRWFWPRINDNIALVDQWVSNDGGDEGLSVDDDGKVQMTSHLGIGVAASSPLTIRNTSSQVRIEYDGTYYSTIAVSSTGTTTVTAVTGGVQLVATTGRIFLQAGNGDVVASLSDNAGSHKISIIDSDTTEVTSIDSAGNIACSGTITPGGNIILGSNYLSGDGGNEGISIDASGNVGIGVAAPTAKLEILGTSTQLKLSYNASKYATFSVDSSSTLDIASEATKIFSAYTTKAVINDGGADVDFIVKSDDNTELIKCDAGTNLTTIGDNLLSLGIVNVKPTAAGTGSYYLGSLTGLAHGVTNYLPTDAFYKVAPANSTGGGAIITAATQFEVSNATPLTLRAIIADECNDGTYEPAFVMDGAVKSGMGIGALTSSDLLQIQNNGTTKIAIEADGTLVFKDTATVWEDANIDLSPLTGGTKPGFNSPGTSGVSLLSFDVGEDVDGVIEIPHAYKLSSTITPHIHFITLAAPSGTDYVKFEIDYWIVDMAGTVTSDGTLTTGDVAVTADDTRYDANFTTISHAALGGQIGFKVKRVAATGDAFAGECGTLTFGFHYEIDTAGSRTITTK